MDLSILLDWFKHYNYVCIPIFAFIIDTIIGDPNSKFHPVALIGRIISFYEAVFYKETDNDTKKLWYGGITVGFILLTVYIIASLLIWIGGLINEWVEYVVQVLIVYITISPRSLGAAGFEINKLLKQGQIDDARHRVSWIVGRDTEELDESEITRATVETIAENTIDGIISPLFFFILGGPIGAILYRTANTMDSMLGYKNHKYMFFGRVAARFDDILNWIPARITFLLLVLSAFILRFDGKAAFRLGLRDAHKHPSPNGGYAEAPVAGALHIRLGGHNVYHDKVTFRAYMGDPIESMIGRHIYETIYLMYTVSILGVVLTIVSTYVINQW